MSKNEVKLLTLVEFGGKLREYLKDSPEELTLIDVYDIYQLYKESGIANFDEWTKIMSDLNHILP